jgi:rRNA maturation endonuclease Nob1
MDTEPKFVCYSCDAEFDILSELDEPVEYCPFCGDMILEDDDDDDEDEEDEYEYEE